MSPERLAEQQKMVIQGLALEVLVHRERRDEAFSLSPLQWDGACQLVLRWPHGCDGDGHMGTDCFFILFFLFFCCRAAKLSFKVCVCEKERKSSWGKGLLEVVYQYRPSLEDSALCVRAHFQQLSQLRSYQNIATVLLTNSSWWRKPLTQNWWKKEMSY